MLSFFPRGVLDEILTLIESVFEDFPSYSLLCSDGYEPCLDKNKVACAPSEDYDQPGHPPSQTRIFSVRLRGN